MPRAFLMQFKQKQEFEEINEKCGFQSDEIVTRKIIQEENNNIQYIPNMEMADVQFQNSHKQLEETEEEISVTDESDEETDEDIMEESDEEIDIENDEIITPSFQLMPNSNETYTSETTENNKEKALGNGLTAPNINEMDQSISKQSGSAFSKPNNHLVEKILSSKFESKEQADTSSLYTNSDENKSKHDILAFDPRAHLTHYWMQMSKHLSMNNNGIPVIYPPPPLSLDNASSSSNAGNNKSNESSSISVNPHQVSQHELLHRQMIYQQMMYYNGQAAAAAAVGLPMHPFLQEATHHFSPIPRSPKSENSYKIENDNRQEKPALYKSKSDEQFNTTKQPSVSTGDDSKKSQKPGSMLLNLQKPHHAFEIPMHPPVTEDIINEELKRRAYYLERQSSLFKLVSPSRHHHQPTAAQPIPMPSLHFPFPSGSSLSSSPPLLSPVSPVSPSSTSSLMSPPLPSPNSQVPRSTVMRPFPTLHRGLSHPPPHVLPTHPLQLPAANLYASATGPIIGYGARRPRDPNKPPPLKKYKCDICSKAFSRSNTLVTHRRIHTGEKPFKCEICSRAFRQPGNLTRHRLTHTTVKPYVCVVCKKAFNRASNLHTHMRTHTHFRPFLCPYCGKAFQQKVDLKIHMYTHSGRE